MTKTGRCPRNLCGCREIMKTGMRRKCSLVVAGKCVACPNRVAVHSSRRGGGRVEIDRVPLIVVVGICAVGKSTVVDGLRQRGFAALEVAQEHSQVPYLWARNNPGAMVYLDAENQVVGDRRSYLKPERVERQRELLSYARLRADIHIDTTHRSVNGVLDEVECKLGVLGIAPTPPALAGLDWKRGETK